MSTWGNRVRVKMPARPQTQRAEHGAEPLPAGVTFIEPPAAGLGGAPRQERGGFYRVAGAAAGGSRRPSERGDVHGELRESLHRTLLTDVDHQGLSSLPTDQARPIVAEMARELIQRDVPQSFRGSREQLLTELIDAVLGLGPLEPLLRDPTVSEIMVNGAQQVFVERGGRILPTDVRFDDDAHVMHVLDRMLASTGRSIGVASPMADTRLPDGSRVNAIIPPASPTGPIVTIRKFVADRLTVEEMVASGSLTEDAAALLRFAVEAGANIVISGGTGSGKTTLLNVLSSWIPSDERIVTIEDPIELSLRQPHVISLEARPPHLGPPVSRADLLRNSLRMRPDRIIIGEVRGAEAFEMLQAMNTGHDGSLTTVHANSPRDALRRIEQMVLSAGLEWPLRAVREQIVSAVDLVLQIARFPDGARRVVGISEVVGMEDMTITMQDLYVLEGADAESQQASPGRLLPTGLRPRGVDLPPELWAVGPRDGEEG